MSYAVVEEKLRLLPQEALDDAGEYLDYLLYKFGAEKGENATLADALNLARNSAKTGIPEKWSRKDFHDDRGM